MMKKEKKILYFHVLLFDCIFICILLTAVSNKWSVSKNGYRGLFKECHVLYGCIPVPDGIHQILQMLIVLACIITAFGFTYGFVASLVKKFIRTKIYTFFLLYFLPGTLLLLLIVLYTTDGHQTIRNDEVEFGWPLYVATTGAFLCFLGSFTSIRNYKEERKIPTLLFKPTDIRKTTISTDRLLKQSIRRIESRVADVEAQVYVNPS